MTTTTTAVSPAGTRPTLAGIDPDDIVDGYRSRGFDRLSDAELIEVVAGAISRPKAAAADSFVLHAPLELLARAALLAFVEPSGRADARRRIAWLGATYEAAGEPVEPPRETTFESAADAVARLRQAIDGGELDDAETAARFLARTVTPEHLVAALGPVVLPRLAAAAHGNIFLYLLPRIAPRSRTAASMVAGLVRELARRPEWQLHWFERMDAAPAVHGTAAAGLIEALVDPPSPGDPGSNFIYPTMSLVERSGLAGERLAGAVTGLDAVTARPSLLRVAAWSMLQDAPDQAPYGWSHCLTLPQAALGIDRTAGDERAAVAVAATYVLGFRSTLGRVAIDPAWVPAPPEGSDVRVALAGAPDEAAAAAWHADPEDRPLIVARLATEAARHPDAHLAKYTLACFDAAHADPEATHVYLAAAAYLSAWWRRVPLDADPILAQRDGG